MEFRTFQDSDYDAHVEVLNRADPSRPFTTEHLRHFDSSRDPDARHARFIVWKGAERIGAVSLETPLSNPEAHELELGLALIPEHLEQASALFSHALNVARSLEAKVLRASSKENFWLYGFLLRHDFQEFDRMWSSNLSLAQFDTAPFQGVLERARDAGLQVRSLETLLTQRDFLARYYAAIVEILTDVPAATPFQPWPFELWQQRTLEGPTFLPEAHFIGFVEDEIAGVSQLFKSPRAGTIQTGLTGVRRAFRHRGIAFALKLEAALYAKARGFEWVRTSNHVVNRPMLTINEALGFEKEPATVSLRKTLTL
jgi:GNAT superfamily N-acetyltransferase